MTQTAITETTVDTRRAAHPHRLGIAAAFAAIFLVWGSIYLAIKWAIETMPPLLMVGTRQILAGVLLYGWMRARGVEAPTAQHWRAAAVIGALVLAVGAGGVAWAQQSVPSGLAALLVATEPFWIILFDWWWHGARRPTMRAAIGVALGFAGVALLVAPGKMGGRVDLLGAVVIICASMSWAAGSLYSRSAPQPRSLLLATAMQMFMGGALLTVAGLLAGEAARFDLAAVTMRSWLAYAFLLVLGSLVSFPAYIWLLQQVSAARVATYAYVNPVIAVLLGWLFANEPLSGRAIAAAAIIVVSVALVITYGEQVKETAETHPIPD